MLKLNKHKIILKIMATLPLVIAFFALRINCELLGALTYISILIFCGYFFFYKWYIKKENLVITLLISSGIFLLYIVFLIGFTIFVAINFGIDLCGTQ